MLSYTHLAFSRFIEGLCTTERLTSVLHSDRWSRPLCSGQSHAKKYICSRLV